MSRRANIQALLALVTIATIGRVAAHEFINWDDPYTIQSAPPLSQTLLHGFMGLWIPATYALWWLLSAVSSVGAGSGPNPWLFHSLSIALHVCNVLLVFQILAKIVPDRTWAACVGAMVFAIHPIQVEAVAWASGMKDLLAAFLALIAIERHLKRSNWLALFAFALALLAKPSSVVAIPIAFTLDVMLDESRRWRTLAPWIIVAMPIALIARIVQSTVGVPRIPIDLRPLVAGDALAFYLGKLIWPIKLAPDYGHLASTISRWTWTIPVLIALLLIRAPRGVRAGAAIFVIALLPVLSFTPFLFQFYSTVADHYVYFAMLGAALAVASCDQRLVGAFAICCVPLAALAFVQAGYWRDSESLFRHNLVVNPTSVVSENNLGAALAQQRRYSEAIEHYNRALDISPNYRMAHTNLAQLYALLGDPDRAIEHLQQALDLWDQTPAGLAPRDSRKEHLMLAEILEKRGRFAEAQQERRKAAQSH